MSSSTTTGCVALTMSMSVLTSSRPSSWEAWVRTTSARWVVTHRGPVDDRRAGQPDVPAHLDRHPLGVQPEDRLAGDRARQRAEVVADREQHPGRRLARRHLDAVQADRVGARRQVEVVAGPHQRDDDAELQGELAPQRAHPVQQVAAGARCRPGRSGRRPAPAPAARPACRGRWTPGCPAREPPRARPPALLGVPASRRPASAAAGR